MPRLRPPQTRGLDEPVHDPAEARSHERRTEPVERAGRLGIPALGDAPEEQSEHGHGDGEVHEERPAPRDVLDQPAPDDGTQHRGDRAERRPGPDGPPPFPFRERCADDGEATRHEERRPDSLHGTGDHELPQAAGEPTGGGRGAEEHDAGRIDAAPSGPISHRASHEEQGGE